MNRKCEIEKYKEIRRKERNGIAILVLIVVLISIMILGLYYLSEENEELKGLLIYLIEYNTWLSEKYEFNNTEELNLYLEYKANKLIYGEELKE